MAEQRIKENQKEIQQTIENRKTADYRMMEYYDNYLHHLWDKAVELQQILEEKQQILREEKEKLVKCEQEVKVLENHKEKKKEMYLAEEKAAELKMFSELGVQRHFLRAREEQAEAELLEQMQNSED